MLLIFKFDTNLKKIIKPEKFIYILQNKTKNRFNIAKFLIFFVKMWFVP